VHNPLPSLVTPDWNQIEALELLTQPVLLGSSYVLCESEQGSFQISLHSTGLRLTSQVQANRNYGLLEHEPEAERLHLETSTNITIVRSSQFILEIEHSPFKFILKNHHGETLLKTADDGHFVRTHRVPPCAKTLQGWLFSFALQSNEGIYGLGEKWGTLNKRGQLLRSYNHDALGVNAEISYKNTPFAWSPKGWSVFVSTSYPVTHAVGYAAWSQRSYCILIEDDSFDIFLNTSQLNPAHANNHGAELIRQYAELTGFAPEPPEWSTGIILSKAYYRDADEILAVANEVRRQAMPCEVITFDGRAWQDTDTRFAFEWCSKRYPDPKPVLEELKALDFKICVWEYPLISTQHPWFTEFSEKGWLLKDTKTNKAYEFEWEREAFGEVLTPLPNSGLVDFTHPDAYQFWLEQHKDLFVLGVDMIKADFGEQIPEEGVIAHNGASGKELHNVYAFLYNRCVYEAAQKYAQKGPFLFSRAAWSGSQRFNSQWGGDPQADWEGMMSNIRGGLSWGLSGAPFYATDVGGFYKDTRDNKLYIRWSQAAVFSAHFRLHGIGAREPWTYSDEANQIVMQTLSLREKLRPYLFRAMQAATKTALPVQRPMVLAFPEQPQSWGFENQFMCGDDLLVAPCFSPRSQVEFYLPVGEWVQLNLDASFGTKLWQGGQFYREHFNLDEIAFTLVSCLFFMGLVGWISYQKTKGSVADKDGYFLAGRGLTGVFIAGSMLLTNLSAEQLIGLNGSAYGFNMTAMAWEVTAGLATIIMALVFLPRYLRGAFITLPAFLEDRFDADVRRMTAILFMLGYGLVTIPSILYSGSVAVLKLFDIPELLNIPYSQALVLTVLAVGCIGALYAVFGGLKAVVVSDTIRLNRDCNDRNT